MESPGVSLKKQVEHEIYEYIIEIMILLPLKNQNFKNLIKKRCSFYKLENGHQVH